MNLVWFAEIRWDYLRTRKQHILSELAKRHKVLYIEPFTLGHRCPFTFRKEGRVSVLTLPALRPSPFKLLNLLMMTKLSWLYYVILHPVLFTNLRQVLRGARIICSNIYFIPMARWFTKPYYWDFNDDPEQFGQLPEWARNSFRCFLLRAQGIFAPSRFYERTLKERFKAPVHYIPNGVEVAGFKGQPDRERKGVCYLGAILDWSFDFGLVKYIAAKLPEGSIHLYGHVEKGAHERLDDLVTQHGIIYRGVLSYRDVPSILRSYRVGIVPLKDRPEVRGAASGKVLQYLAGGLMVVSRPMEEYRDYSPCIRFGVSLEEFTESVQDFLDNPVRDEGLMDKLRNRDWKNLAAQVEQIIT